MTDLVHDQRSSHDQARAWAKLPLGELKRRAARAASARDLDALWGLTKAHLYLHSAKGSTMSAHTLRTYARGIKDLLEAWQGENLLRPSRNAGVLYVRKLESGPDALKPATVRVKIAAAKALYSALRWAGASEAVPFEQVKAAVDLTPSWDKRGYYNDAEVERLLALAEPPEAVVVLLGAHAGLRISEMCALRWDQVALERRTLMVTGKGGKRAQVSMSQRLCDALMALQQWRDPRKRAGREPLHVLPWQTDRVRQRFRALCQRAGVEYRGKAVHGLRHGAGTKAYRSTQDLGRVAAHLRHSNVETTRGYAKLVARDLTDMVEDW